VGRVISNGPHATSILRWSTISCLPADFRCTQGSVLGPLFLLRTYEVYAIITAAGLVGHLYIIALAASSSATVQQFITFAERLDARLCGNRLKMNADETQLLWLGTRQQLNRLTTTEVLNSSCCPPESSFQQPYWTWAVSWAWPTTSPLSAGHVSSSFVSWG